MFFVFSPTCGPAFGRSAHGMAEHAARSGPRFAPLGFLLLAGYENLTAPAPLFANAKLKWQFLLPEVRHSDSDGRLIAVP
jgi:hypothetical protein